MRLTDRQLQLAFDSIALFTLNSERTRIVRRMFPDFERSVLRVKGNRMTPTDFSFLDEAVIYSIAYLQSLTPTILTPLVLIELSALQNQIKKLSTSQELTDTV